MAIINSMKKYPKQKGFVILFTILISVIILMIGLGIFSIATRETVLSGTAREAQFAFYAADAGVECALYAETLDVFNSSGNGGQFPCGAISVTAVGPNTFTFDVLIDTVNKTCAHVTVIDGGNSRRVVSQGYNICDALGKPAKTNPLLVERDLDTTYGIDGGSGLDATIAPIQNVQSASTLINSLPPLIVP
jgi:Tfp pilus assembly protein PilX